MDNVVVTITIHSQEIKKDKQSFIASSAEINGKWYKIKFTKDCNLTPKVKGLYDLTINFDDCSVENGKVYRRTDGTTGVANDTIWVQRVIELREYTDEELKAVNRYALGNIFGSH